MNISIFGLGYVGCVSLGCLSNNGHNVIGVDVVDHKIDLINSGKPTIIEKDIDEIISKQHKKGRISAAKDSGLAVKETELSFICVGTPSSETGQLNLKYVYKVAEDIGKSLKNKEDFHVVIIRSTVMPGTNKKIGEIIESASGKKRNVDFSVVSNPEFLREGSAVHDYYHPAVTVIGGDHEGAMQKVAALYKELDAPIEFVAIQEAEIIKYVNNTFHALKISFANEIGNICKKLEIDSHRVMDLFCKDDKLNLSAYYFKPGFAYGGSCLPKDLKGLRTIAHDNYVDVPIINAIENTNENQKKIALNMVLSQEGKNVGILGLSFKAGTDDLRYSPAVELVENLIGKGYQIRIYDKNVNLSQISGTNKHFIEQRIPHISNLISDNLEEIAEFADVLVITQGNPIFKDLISKYPNKKFIDLVRIEKDLKIPNLQGICW